MAIDHEFEAAAGMRVEQQAAASGVGTLMTKVGDLERTTEILAQRLATAGALLVGGGAKDWVTLQTAAHAQAVEERLAREAAAAKA